MKNLPPYLHKIGRKIFFETYFLRSVNPPKVLGEGYDNKQAYGIEAS